MIHPCRDCSGFLSQRTLPSILGFLFEEQYNYRKEQRTPCRLKWQVASPYRNLGAKLNSVQMPFTSPSNVSFFITGNWFKWGILADWMPLSNLITYLPCLMQRSSLNCLLACLFSSEITSLLASHWVSLISLFEQRIIHFSHCYEILKKGYWLLRMTHTLHPSFTSFSTKWGRICIHDASLFFFLDYPLTSPHLFHHPPNDTYSNCYGQLSE